MRLVVISSGLALGGAERLLLELVSRWEAAHWQVSIFSLSGSGDGLEEKFRALGVEVRCYNIKSVRGFFLGFPALVRDLRSSNPQVVQTWMIHADLLGGILAKLFTRAPILWGAHHASFSPVSLKWHTYLSVRALAILSHVIPVAVVAVSAHVKEQLINIGYCKDRIVVIENGIDLTRHHVNMHEDKHQRRSLVRIGFVGRFNPEKRPQDFVAIADLLGQRGCNAEFIMVGSGNSLQNSDLGRLVRSTCVQSKFRLMGERSDVPELLNQWDILVSTSPDEAFGLALIEGMASGCFVVSSDNAGARLVGGAHIHLVPLGNIEAFADTIELLAALPLNEKTKLLINARDHVSSKYSIQMTALAYKQLYESHLLE